MRRLGHRLDAPRDDLRDEPDVALELVAGGNVDRSRGGRRGRLLLAAAAGQEDRQEHETGEPSSPEEPSARVVESSRAAAIMRACERSCRSRSLVLVLALAAGLRLGLEAAAAGGDRSGGAVGREHAAAARAARAGQGSLPLVRARASGPGEVHRAPAGRDRPRHDPQHRQARLPADRPAARPLRQARRPGSGAAADPAHAVELPRGGLSGVEPSRPATGRGGRGHRHLGELVRPGRQGRRRTSRRARCESSSPAAAGTSTRTTTPSRRASTRSCRRRSGSPASSRASSRAGGSSRTRSCRDRCPGQPVHGRRGRLLRFRVVLRNRSRTTATFEHCPAYIEQLAPSGQGRGAPAELRRRRADRARQERRLRDADPRPAQRPARRERPLLGARSLRVAQPATARQGDDRPLTVAASRAGAVLPRARAESASRPGRRRSR